MLVRLQRSDVSSPGLGMTTRYISLAPDDLVSKGSQDMAAFENTCLYERTKLNMGLFTDLCGVNNLLYKSTKRMRDD